MVRAFSAIFIAAAVSACGTSIERDPVISEMKRADTKRWMEVSDLRLDGFRSGQPSRAAIRNLLDLGWRQEEELFVAYAERLSEPLPENTIIFSKHDDWSSVACNLKRFVFIEQDGGLIVSTRGATGEAGCL
ncbi:MAG: hypothetical protein CMK09_14010 [Ponticaulis sp.]|nr:hypothetical protein [Ponticaulis sp.]